MSRFTGPVVAIAIALPLAFGIAPSAFAGRGDTKPPRISITTPAAGGAAAGTLSVSGSAADNRRIARVAVSVDSGRFVRATGTKQWTASVDTTGYPDGTHILHARAWDARGNARTASISVNVANTHSAGAQSLVTPEGTRIDVNSAGPWTASQVYDMLKANGLDAKIGATLQVHVQDSYPSQVTTDSSTSNGETTFSATIYLQGVNSSFAAAPDSVVGHEFGHVWTLYHLAVDKNGDWSSYLAARGLAGDSRLNSTYSWTPREIIADDYRLLFGSAAAISQAPKHLNSDIPDPRNVAGLRDFLANSW